MEYPPHPSPRIVSLLPAATEIVARLGLRANLVGRSHECDEPADVAELPALTAARIDAAAPSRDIHEQVTQVGRSLAAASPQAQAGAACGTGNSAALFTLDADRLAALEPDRIRLVDARGAQDEVAARIWDALEGLRP